MTQEIVGPILLARGFEEGKHRLSALLITARDQAPPPLTPASGQTVEPLRLSDSRQRTIWRYDFALSPQQSHYQLGPETFEVAVTDTPQTRVAFVSCNGQEDGDLLRPEGERNALWYRLREEHEAAPFHLMLHGGDQLYADPVWEAHAALKRWTEAGRREQLGMDFTEEMRAAACEFYIERYCQVYAQPPTAWLLARVPSLMIWDDHDIFDGWGSHPEEVLDCPVGAGVFQAARQAYCLLQLGMRPEDEPPGALDPSGASLGWVFRYPDFTVIAPDLRSERRPNQVMGAPGWQGFRNALEAEPDDRRILMLSSVPALGPRLSWVEACIGFVPKLRQYEDDLRDQWQSRHHRSEWIRFLSFLEQQINLRRQHITLLSGEIHLATRAEMRLEHGALHQLVASGIAHPPPPKAYARALGLLASFGETPLPGRPISLHPLPGRSKIYAAQRNFLLLNCNEAGRWHAVWFLEETGWTEPLDL